MAVTLNASTTAGLVTSADTSGNLDLQAGGVTKIAVTSAGVAVTGLSKASLPTGSVLQVVTATTSTGVTSTSTSFVTSGLSASITPTSATSKIYISLSTSGYNDGSSYISGWALFRGTVAGTNLGDATWGFAVLSPSLAGGTIAYSYLDSPATTSATTYTLGMRTQNAAMPVRSQYPGTTATITLMEIAA
jgi:hypothetical protein